MNETMAKIYKKKKDRTALNEEGKQSRIRVGMYIK